MKSISKRTSKKGVVTWQAIVRMKNEPAITATKPTRQEAQEFADGVESEMLAAESAKRNPLATLPFTGNWMDEKLITTIQLFAASKRCIKTHRSRLRNLEKQVGAVTIGALDEDWIQGYIDKTRRTNSGRGRPFAVSTIVKQLALVGVILKWRAKQLKLPKPTFILDKKSLPKGWDSGRKRRLEHGEAYLIGMAIRKSKQMDIHRRRQYILLIRLALETAARLQELVLAEWHEISIQRKSWNLPGIHTKCDYDRNIPLSRRARRILLRLRDMQLPGNSKIFGHLFSPSMASRYFAKAVERSGVVDFVFHDLRHEAISRFVCHPNPWPVPKLMEITGHSDYDTFKGYVTMRDNAHGDFMD